MILTKIWQYSGKEVEHLEESIDQNIASLIRLIEKYIPEKGEFSPLDFGRKAQYFTLDVISNVSYGESFGYLEKDTDVNGYIQEVEKVLPAANMVTALPWINFVLQTRLVKKFLPSDKDPIGFGKLMA